MQKQNGTWVKVTDAAAFSPRDTAEDAVFKDRMWLSNGYYHGNVLHRDLWSSSDGKTWDLVSTNTPYDGYSEMVVFNGKLWAVKGSVWNSDDGENWTRVLEKTPFGLRGYGETVIFKDQIWQLGSGPDVWCSPDGKEWTCVCREAPYGARSASAVVVFDNKLWVMGGTRRIPNDPPEKGYKNSTTYNDVWCSPDGVKWTRILEHAPWAPRQWFIGEVYKGRMWIVGGFDNVNNGNLGDIWYTVNGKDWKEFKSDPVFTPRHEPTLYVYEDSLWVAAGNSWPVKNDVWRLTLP